MDSILADQLEWLISGNMEGLRFKRQLVLLASCLAEQDIPDNIERQVANLSKRIALEEVFEALLKPLNEYLRNGGDKESSKLDISGLVSQIEATRQALNECEPVNQAILIAWLINRAREKKLLSKIRGMR